jgi:Heavy-metal resistance
MKSAIVILVAGVLACAAAFFGFYFLGTASHRELLHGHAPELAWLKREFGISDAEFTRVTKLHEAYEPQCQEMCRRIDEQTTKLKTLLAATNTVTSEMEATLAESARLRAECQRNMLRHFFAVSQTMPPEQGRRYIEWISERTFGMAHRMHGMDH